MQSIEEQIAEQRYLALRHSEVPAKFGLALR